VKAEERNGWTGGKQEEKERVEIEEGVGRSWQIKVERGPGGHVTGRNGQTEVERRPDQKKGTNFATEVIRRRSSFLRTHL